MNEEEIDKQLLELSIELAKQGIDIEQLIINMQPMFDVFKQIYNLSLKNYTYLKKLKKVEDK